MFQWQTYKQTLNNYFLHLLNSQFIFKIKSSPEKNKQQQQKICARRNHRSKSLSMQNYHMQNTFNR